MNGMKPNFLKNSEDSENKIFIIPINYLLVQISIMVILPLTKFLPLII